MGLITLPDSDLRWALLHQTREELIKEKQAIKRPNNWKTLPDDGLLAPEALGRTLIAQLQEVTHLSVTKTLNFWEADTTKLR